MGDLYAHTADWHLRDSQFASPNRGDDFTNAAFTVIDVCMGYGVKAIFNSGDILNNRRPSSRNIQDLTEIDKRLRSAGIPMFVISGNHDLARPSWISILDEETRQDSSKKTSGIINADNKTLPIGDTGMTVYGLPSVGARAFRQVGWPDADILLSHELVKEFCAFPADKDALSIADYPTDKYKAILLGDIHTCKYKIVDECLIGYPDSIELCSRVESTEKSVTMLEIEKKVITNVDSLKHISIPTRMSLVYRIHSEEEAEIALADLKSYVDQDPIVLIKYDRRMHSIPAMFRTVLVGSKALLRCAAFADINAAHILGVGGENEELLRLKKPQDFVADYIPANTKLYSVALTLCDPEQDHRRVVTDYVMEEMKEENADSTFKNPGLWTA